MEAQDLANPLDVAVGLTYESTDISAEVSEDLLSLTYTDKIGDEADELTVTLKDETGKWAGSWSPERGATVSALITGTMRGILETGSMMIDTLETSGGSSGRTFSFSAVSIPLNSTIRRTPKNRNFEKFKLSAIASQIASENGLELLFDSQEDPEYDRIDQRQESDLSFLKRLCSEAGLTVKCADKKLVFFDQKSYESKAPAATVTLGTSPVLAWSFSAQQSERYRAVTVKWRDIKKKTRAAGASAASRAAGDPEGMEGFSDIAGTNSTGTPKKGIVSTPAEYVDYTYEDTSVPETGQVYVIKKRCTSQAEAERLAKAKLRELNLRQLTGSLTLIGDPYKVAGIVIEVRGFGSFDGKFIVEEAAHSVGAQGYITELSLRRVNLNY